MQVPAVLVTSGRLGKSLQVLMSQAPLGCCLVLEVGVAHRHRSDLEALEMPNVLLLVVSRRALVSPRLSILVLN